MKKIFTYLLVFALYPLTMPWLIIWFPTAGNWWIETYAHYICFVMKTLGVQ